jgi:hypothetical protein
MMRNDVVGIHTLIGGKLSECVIGDNRWSDPLLTGLDQLYGGVGAWALVRENAQQKRWFSGMARIRCLQQQQASLDAFIDRAREVENEGKSVDTKLQTELKDHLAPLAEAMVELAYLFTPARWAYDPVQIKYDHRTGQLYWVDGARVPVKDMRVRNTEELFRNVAKMNTLLVALFLLRGPVREDNSLRLLIMDDPLQNMDETVGKHPLMLSRGDFTGLLRRLCAAWSRCRYQAWFVQRGCGRKMNEVAWGVGDGGWR